MAEESSPWWQVSAKATALLALHRLGLSEGTLLQKADFLQQLGIPRPDVAAMLGTSPESIAAGQRRRRRTRRARGQSK